MKIDSQLQRDVMDELRWEPQVDSAHIGVTAKNGVVTLTGSVPNYSQKLAAEGATCRVAGVKAIAEEIDVRFVGDPPTSDPEIAERIVNMLKWDVTVPDDITVKVEHGRVTLTGQVDWNYQKALGCRVQTGQAPQGSQVHQRGHLPHVTRVSQAVEGILINDQQLSLGKRVDLRSMDTEHHWQMGVADHLDVDTTRVPAKLLLIRISHQA